jgi:immune inhibitor A
MVPPMEVVRLEIRVSEKCPCICICLACFISNLTHFIRRIPSFTDYWIGDYTINPENGGLGVFAHEYGHDLGLPDLYNSVGPGNSVGFWDLYGSGSWLGKGAGDIGDNPGPMNAWEKLVLGWLNYEVIEYQEKKSVRLGPLTSNSKAIQAAFLLLPSKVLQETFVYAPSGDYMYHSGVGNDLANHMYLTVWVPTLVAHKS